MEALKFSNARKEVPVEITDPTGTDRNWTLREMTGKGRDKYLNEVRKFITMGPKGADAQVKRFDGYQATLLHFCLFDENDENVSIEEIQELPVNIVSKLFDVAQEMNALNELGQEAAKNDSGENE